MPKSNLLQTSSRFFFGAYLLVILFVSTIPGSASTAVGCWDKAAHFVEYFIFMALWLCAYATVLPLNLKKRLRGLLFAVAYGGLIELIQSALPWRSAEAADALMNGLGALAGWLVIEPWLTHRYKNRVVEHDS